VKELNGRSTGANRRNEEGRMRGRTPIFAWTVFLLLAVPLQAQELSQEFKINSYSSIMLPDSWRRISGSEMSLAKNAARAAGVKLPMDAEAGFQRGTAASFSYPYITVSKHSAWGLIAKDVDDLLKKIEDSIGEVDMRQIEKDAAGLVHQPKVEDIYYDTPSGAVVVQLHMKLFDRSGATGKAAFFFVKGGWLQLNFYSSQSGFAGDDRLFDKIVRALKIDPAYRYNPIGASWAGAAFNGLPVKAKLGLLALLFGLLGRVLQGKLPLNKARASSFTARIVKEQEAHTPPARPPREQAVDRPQSPQCAAPDPLENEPLLAQIQAVVAPCAQVQKAELFRTAGEDGAAQLILAIELCDGLPLRQQQEIMKDLRFRIPEGGVAKILRDSQLAGRAVAGQGLTVIDRRGVRRMPLEEAAPARNPKWETGISLEG
jgi:hypothetical protein